MLADGVHGLYITGSTGEGFLMDLEERKRAVEITVDEVAGKVPVMVHVGAISSKLSVDLTRHAYEAGADAISSVPPCILYLSESWYPDSIYCYSLMPRGIIELCS